MSGWIRINLYFLLLNSWLNKLHYPHPVIFIDKKLKLGGNEYFSFFALKELQRRMLSESFEKSFYHSSLRSEISFLRDCIKHEATAIAPWTKKIYAQIYASLSNTNNHPRKEPTLFIRPTFAYNY